MREREWIEGVGGKANRGESGLGGEGDSSREGRNWRKRERDNSQQPSLRCVIETERGWEREEIGDDHSNCFQLDVLSSPIVPQPSRFLVHRSSNLAFPRPSFLNPRVPLSVVRLSIPTLARPSSHLTLPPSVFLSFCPSVLLSLCPSPPHVPSPSRFFFVTPGTRRRSNCTGFARPSR